MSDGKYWTDAYNAILGCQHAGPSCAGCWAETVVGRMAAAGQGGIYPVEQDDRGRWRWTGGIGRLKRPPTFSQTGRAQVYAINWLGDLWYEEARGHAPAVLDAALATTISRAMNRKPPHVLLFLTHRPLAMVEDVLRWVEERSAERNGQILLETFARSVWWGVTVTRQRDLINALEIRHLPGHRWLSIEPIEERIDFANHMPAERRPEWIAAGTSTTDPSLCQPEHLRAIDDLVSQCRVRKIPIWVKQAGTLRGKHLGPDLAREMPPEIEDAFDGKR